MSRDEESSTDRPSSEPVGNSLPLASSMPSPSGWPGPLDGMAVLSLSGEIRLVNQPLVDLLRVASPTELIGKSCFECVAVEARDQTARMIAQAPRGVQQGELRLVRKGGLRFPAEVQVTAMRDVADEPTSVLAIIRDRSSTDDAEDSRRRFEQVASCSADHICYIDRDYVYRAVNDAFLAAYCKGRDEVVGRTVADVLGKKSFAQVAKPNLDRCFAGESVIVEAEALLPTRRRVVMDVHYHPCRDDQGIVTGAAVVARDVTERTEAERRLRRSERRYRQLVERAPFGVVVSRGSGQIASVNAKACEILECSEQDLRGKDGRDFVGERCMEVLTGMMAALERDGAYDGVELELSNGKLVRVNSVVLSRRSSIHLNLFEDVTDRRRLERQVAEAHKMEAIGTLAGGVAHEMNNVLAVILGLASAVQADLKHDDPLQEDIAEILAASRRGKALTQSMLGFARRGRYRKERTSLDRIVLAVQSLLLRTVPKDVAVQVTLSPELPEVECDVAQLTQALMNLCLNALDAVAGKGRLMITTAAIEIDEGGRAEGPDLSPGQYVKLSVQDDGPGMDAETAQRAVEPFFTTKEVGKGTGLGLSMAYGVAQGHGGGLHIDSAVGRGTTVALLLPALEPAPISEHPEVSVSRPLGAPNRTVLVVDDEAMVRNTAKRLLEVLGFDVVLASGGADALEQFRKLRDVIDVVLLDLVMPEMDGLACLEALRAVDEDVPVVLCSGHVEDARVKDLARRGVLGVLLKPFDLRALGEVLGAAVGR